jgi:hypothetical protein
VLSTKYGLISTGTVAIVSVGDGVRDYRRPVGKATWTDARVQAPHAVVSTDEIRQDSHPGSRPARFTSPTDESQYAPIDP